jgi:hypothetical protein
VAALYILHAMIQIYTNLFEWEHSYV